MSDDTQAGSGMPPDVRELYDRLDSMEFEARACHTFCRQLFGDRERIGVLEATARDLFYTVQCSLYDTMAQSLCHFTDPMRMGKHENTTIDRLVDAVGISRPGTSDPAKIHDLVVELKSLTGDKSPIREARSRFIAHRDWGRRGVKSMPVEVESFEKALDLIAEILDRVWHLYAIGRRLKFPDRLRGDGDELIRVLKHYRRLMNHPERLPRDLSNPEE